jgi:hypothetical protein
LLAGLTVAAPDPAQPAYHRAAFGRGWHYDRITGCDTRELVLRAESRTSPRLGPRCKVLAGEWVSVYDGVTTQDPADLQIDHLVALADAWRSGAATWTAARRQQYANDLTDPRTLLAVTGHTNQSKGDEAPDTWMPPARGAWCGYADSWVRVKARWHLSVTRPEHDALAAVLAACPS